MSGVEYLAENIKNPFDLSPPCDPFVPGYGRTNGDFHVIGDHPGRHGGSETGIPFTDSESGAGLQAVLERVGLLRSPGREPEPVDLFLSYLYPCVQQSDPTDAEYAELAQYFDAELRAITAHVLLPVGERPIRYVLANCTSVPPTDVDVTEMHATEISGGGWLVVPVAEPTTWTGSQRDALIDTITAIRSRDYRRESDLGRFFPGEDAYMVR